MKICYTLISLSLFLLACNSGPKNYNGLYIGDEEMCSIDSGGKKHCYSDSFTDRKWYHKVLLKIKGDSVYADANPVSVGLKHDTVSSASDGAYFYYRGLNHVENGAITVNLKEVYCDYCARPIKLTNGSWAYVQRNKVFKGFFKGNDILLNGIVFKKSVDQKLYSEEIPADLLNTNPQ